MKNGVAFAAIAWLGVVTACSDDVPPRLFSETQATTLTQRFLTAAVGTQPAEVLELSEAPFHFATRTWKTEADLKNNLIPELQRISSLLKDAGEIEAFAYQELVKGRWPRERKIPKADRRKAAAGLGVRDNGYLMHCHPPGRLGWFIILNPDAAGTRLTVQGLRKAE